MALGGCGEKSLTYTKLSLAKAQRVQSFCCWHSTTGTHEWATDLGRHTDPQSSQFVELSRGDSGQGGRHCMYWNTQPTFNQNKLAEHTFTSSLTRFIASFINVLIRPPVNLNLLLTVWKNYITPPTYTQSTFIISILLSFPTLFTWPKAFDPLFNAFNHSPLPVCNSDLVDIYKGISWKILGCYIVCV